MTTLCAAQLAWPLHFLNFGYISEYLYIIGTASRASHLQCISSGVAKAGHVPKAPYFVPFMLCDLAQSAHERLAYSRFAANTQ